MLKTINCTVEILHMHRIGKKTDSSRPIKSFLKSQSDQNQLLNSTCQLKGSSKYASIHSDHWLSKEKLDQVKSFRRRCKELNKKEVQDPSSKKKYKVISGRLMKHSDDGKLYCYNTTCQKSKKLTLLIL